MANRHRFWLPLGLMCGKPRTPTFFPGVPCTEYHCHAHVALEPGRNVCNWRVVVLVACICSHILLIQVSDRSSAISTNLRFRVVFTSFRGSVAMGLVVAQWWGDKTAWRARDIRVIVVSEWVAATGAAAVSKSS